MLELQHLLAEGARELADAGIEEPHLEARLLMALAAQVTQVDILRADLHLDEGAIARFRAFVSARAQRVPYAYLAGKKEFYGLEFHVTPDVLIPRPETETLVEVALRELRTRQSPYMVDVGTGSGCIAVACAVHMPTLRAIALDVSKAALRVARCNVTRHGVASRVAVVCSDLLSAVRRFSADVVVSNPPYVASEEVANLQPEVARYEPREALDGGSTGMEYHERLADQAKRVLKPGGWLMVETALGQAQKVAQLLQARGYNHLCIHPDLAGIERVVCGSVG